jgi:hypothetical protein
MKLDEIERWLLSDQDTVLPAGAWTTTAWILPGSSPVAANG